MSDSLIFYQDWLNIILQQPLPSAQTWSRRREIKGAWEVQSISKWSHGFELSSILLKVWPLLLTLQLWARQTNTERASLALTITLDTLSNTQTIELFPSNQEIESSRLCRGEKLISCQYFPLPRIIPMRENN